MIRPRQRCAVILGLIWSTVAALSQTFPSSAIPSVSSVSGQFIVSASAGLSALSHHAVVVGSPDFVRLEPTFLAISAERLKASLHRTIGLKSGAPWSGKIYLRIRPANSLDDDAILIAQPFLRSWNCGVELPDVISRARLARALTAALLLEMANRNMGADGHSAEIPSWLADGLAEEILAADGEKIILSTPTKIVNDLPQARIERDEHSIDVLAAARKTLQNSAPLTFDELSWPTPAQLSGADGGAYRSSAQLLVHALLALKAGPEKLRAMLAKLPDCANWQTAFLSAYAEYFPRTLAVEKWWSLRIVNFAARDPGPGWTAVNSGERLAEILAVPVEFRTASNALPEHAEISLQTALRSFDVVQQAAVLSVKLRDLSLAQLRMTPAVAGLVDGYRRALLNYLGENDGKSTVTTARAPMRRTASVAATLKKLDALDIRRRELEMKLRGEAIQRNLNRSNP